MIKGTQAKHGKIFLFLKHVLTDSCVDSNSKVARIFHYICITKWKGTAIFSNKFPYVA
jgi:hypothetical protein